MYSSDYNAGRFLRLHVKEGEKNYCSLEGQKTKIWGIWRTTALMNIITAMVKNYCTHG